MVTRVSTVAFEGIDARPVDVQVQIAPGNVVLMIVGLADKAGLSPASGCARR
jgi:magnesium chelatase family protein